MSFGISHLASKFEEKNASRNLTSLEIRLLKKIAFAVYSEKIEFNKTRGDLIKENS